MDIVRLLGGLGNQMFQYALVEALRNRGRQVYCNLGLMKWEGARPVLIDKIFKGVYLNEIGDDAVNKIYNESSHFLANRRKVFEEICFEDVFFHKDVFDTKDCIFTGYWQSEKYFADCQERIREVFQFSCIPDEVIRFGEELSKNTVSIHIRRGDYLKHKEYAVCDEKYYKDAIQYIRNIIPDVQFICFSDDKQWMNKSIELRNEGITICSEELFSSYCDWYDMYLMTCCRGNIIANSSFSWWASWLNKHKDKIIVAPKFWINGWDIPDIWCDNWIRM